MISTAPSIEDMTLNVTQEIQVNAPIDVTFDALLEQLGPGNETPDGKPMQMKIEAWPGGRWFRDLGDGNGHFWANVQAIKRPALIEFYGPLFMSYPVASNVQYRLTEANGGTLIKFQHRAFGVLPEDLSKGVSIGWTYMHEQAKKRAEAKRK
jgi:hypothetical protein